MSAIPTSVLPPVNKSLSTDSMDFQYENENKIPI